MLVIAKGIESTKKSKADVARRIEALCNTFDVTIVTACSEECQSLFRNARVIGTPRLGIPRDSAVFIMSCWLLLPFIRSDVVYLSEVYNAPAIVTLFRRRVVCYGNTHPMQHILGVEAGRRIASTIFSAVYKWALRCGLNKCDIILAISPQLSSAFLQYGIPRCRVQTVETGVPLEVFHHPVERDLVSCSPFVVVYHGTVSSERGLQVMVDGVRLLSRKRRDFKVRLVGCDKTLIVQLGKTLMENGILDLFDLRPPVPNSEIPELLRTAHCGVSLLEPNVYFSASPPLKVLEYMAAGLPVIANDLPTHKLYLEDRTDSLLVDYTAESFADALEELMENEPMRRRLSVNAIRRSSGHSDSAPISRLIEHIHSLQQRRVCIEDETKGGEPL